MIKTLKKLRIEGTYLDIIKVHTTNLQPTSPRGANQNRVLQRLELNNGAHSAQFFPLLELGFKLRALHLKSRHSTA
jgi:hypothetical protein